MVVYWNFQNSACRRPGSPDNGGRGDGSLADYNLGAALRAAYGPSDFALLELDDPVPDRADAFFAGWTTRAEPPADTLVCIHHPASDEKRISFSFSDAYPGRWGRGAERIAGRWHERRASLHDSIVFQDPRGSPSRGRLTGDG